MIAVLCDLCRRELVPRQKGQYDWVSKGGVVVLVQHNGLTEPARLVCDGNPVNEVCSACAQACYARVWLRVSNREKGSGRPVDSTAGCR